MSRTSKLINDKAITLKQVNLPHQQTNTIIITTTFPQTQQFKMKQTGSTNQTTKHPKELLIEEKKSTEKNSNLKATSERVNK